MNEDSDFIYLFIVTGHVEYGKPSNLLSQCVITKLSFYLAKVFVFNISIGS